MKRLYLILSILSFGLAGIVYYDVLTGAIMGGDPNWFAISDLWGIHHESLFVAGIILGFVFLYLAWRR